MAKILFILVSDSEERVRMALNFVKNRKDKDEIRVLFWGPSEKLLANNETLAEEYLSVIKPQGCIFYAKGNNIDKNLENKVELLPAGDLISKSIEEGFSIITL